MTSIVNRLQKTLGHHVPMIRFRYGLKHSSTHQEGKTQETSSATISSDNNSSTKNIHRPPAALEFLQTPKKYRRRPLTQDEIDLIHIGGST